MEGVRPKNRFLCFYEEFRFPLPLQHRRHSCGCLNKLRMIDYGFSHASIIWLPA